MEYKIIRPQGKIDEVLNWVAKGLDEGSHYPGESYESGIQRMFEWLTGIIDEDPRE